MVAKANKAWEQVPDTCHICYEQEEIWPLKEELASYTLDSCGARSTCFLCPGIFLNSYRRSSKHDMDTKLLLTTLLLSSRMLSSAFSLIPTFPIPSPSFSRTCCSYMQSGRRCCLTWVPCGPIFLPRCTCTWQQFFCVLGTVLGFMIIGFDIVCFVFS